MRMSYSTVRAEFFQLLLDIPNSGRCYNHARNFYAMMEFFVPLVHSTLMICYFCSHRFLTMVFVFVHQISQTFENYLISFTLLLQFSEVVNISTHLACSSFFGLTWRRRITLPCSFYESASPTLSVKTSNLLTGHWVMLFVAPVVRVTWSIYKMLTSASVLCSVIKNLKGST